MATPPRNSNLQRLQTPGAFPDNNEKSAPSQSQTIGGTQSAQNGQDDRGCPPHSFKY